MADMEDMAAAADMANGLHMAAEWECHNHNGQHPHPKWAEEDNGQVNNLTK
jgi:hypothetical protein